MDTDDPEIPNSLEIAHKRGIKIVWTIRVIAMLLPQYDKDIVKMTSKQSVWLGWAAHEKRN